MRCKLLTTPSRPEALLLLPLEAEPRDVAQGTEVPSTAAWQVICYVDLDGQADALARLARQRLRKRGHLFLSLDELDQLDQPLPLRRAARGRMP